jgi:hypothetical protein
MYFHSTFCSIYCSLGASRTRKQLPGTPYGLKSFFLCHLRFTIYGLYAIHYHLFTGFPGLAMYYFRKNHLRKLIICFNDVCIYLMSVCQFQHLFSE